MKIQDVVFLVIFILLTLKRNDKWTMGVGIFCFFASIPLFTVWIFFTAERLVWFAGAFFVLAVIQQAIHRSNILNK